MSIEVILFVVVGAVSIAAAAMMLLSENAVHSALFLILNFFCVALLYLMLEASFLALVQIAVYAGAIMVLFLFVIMLLGAEKLAKPDREFKWMPPLALALVLALLIAGSLALIQGEVDTREPVADQPMLRVIHAAPDFGPADVYLNNDLVGDGLGFRSITDYERVESGSYNVVIADAGDDPAAGIPLGTITLEPGEARTVIAYGELIPSLAVLDDDLSTLPARETRVTVFNAYTGLPAVALINTGSNFELDESQEVVNVVEPLAQGEASEMDIFGAGSQTWAFVNADNPNQFLLRLRDLSLERNTSQFLILAGEREVGSGDEALRPVLVEAGSGTVPQFGGPASIGGILFVEYVLPFQLVAILLLVAMVGAIVLTQRIDVKPKPGRPTRRKVSRPLTSVVAAQTGSDVMEGQPRLSGPDSEQPEANGD